MKKTHKKHLNIKSVIIIVISLLLLASATTWYVYTQATKSVVKSKNSLSVALIALNGAISDNKLSHDQKILAINDYTLAIKNIKLNLCNLDKNDPLSSSMRLVKTCTSKQVEIDNIIRTSDQSVGIIKADSDLSKIISDTPKASTVHDQAAYWVDISSKYADYQTVDIIKDEKQAVTDLMTRYATSWQELEDADNNQDESAFNKARQAIIDLRLEITKKQDIFHVQLTKTNILLSEQIRLFNS